MHGNREPGVEGRNPDMGHHGASDAITLEDECRDGASRKTSHAKRQTRRDGLSAAAVAPEDAIELGGERGEIDARERLREVLRSRKDVGDVGAHDHLMKPVPAPSMRVNRGHLLPRTTVSSTTSARYALRLMTTVPPMSRGQVRQGGKEELRASVLKTYLLRVRAEKGERAVRQLLAQAGIDPTAVDNERGWVSSEAAKRALRQVVQLLGNDALRHRGEWTTHPEALGTLVRMLRVAKQPVDAYRYLAANAKEVTRVGTWEIEELGGANEKVTAPIHSVRMTYRPRDDANEDSADKLDAEGEELLSASREGDLAAFPVIWGLPEAEVVREACISKGGEASVYLIKWRATRARTGPAFAALAAFIACGALVGVVGGWGAGLIAAFLAGALGGGAGLLWDRSQDDKASRTFERNRIAALERGLELRGELGATPGELTGTVLGGKFRIGRKIGSGGIGVVYAAEHTTLGHEVAVKVLRGAAAKDGGEIARLRREAYIQVHVEHPNVVRVLDLDQMPDGSIYVVMERLIGRSLADKMAREGLLAPGFAIPVFIGVCRALAAAHKKGVVHRDLKPGNVFLCEDGNSKVLDFGMSKLTTAESLTQTGYTLGTPEYMAPEQCIGANVEARTDLYALGVLMYEALTGELPISAQNRRDLLDLHQRQVPTAMRQKRADLPIPEMLDAAVMKCLKKRMNERPKSATELELMLSAIPLEGLPVSYPPGTSRKAPLQGAAKDVKDKRDLVAKDAREAREARETAAPPRDKPSPPKPGAPIDATTMPAFTSAPPHPNGKPE
jgi:eukaryotic-like serine/threonine-protein kinase